MLNLNEKHSSKENLKTCTCTNKKNIMNNVMGYIVLLELSPGVAHGQCRCIITIDYRHVTPRTFPRLY